MWSARLGARPLSGEVDEVFVEAKCDPVTSVFFESTNEDEYCAIFGGNEGSYQAVEVLGGKAFIVSFGQGYIFNIGKRTLLHKTDLDMICNLCVNTERSLFIISDSDTIYVHKHAQIWQFELPGSDGINFTGVTDGVLRGTYWLYGERRIFELDLDTYDLKSDVATNAIDKSIMLNSQHTYIRRHQYWPFIMGAFAFGTLTIGNLLVGDFNLINTLIFSVLTTGSALAAIWLYMFGD